MPAVVTNGREKRMDLEASVRQCDPILTPSIILYGARVVGKDTITDVLAQDPQYVKISSHSPFRLSRAGEQHKVATGIEKKGYTFTDLQNDRDGFLAWFFVDDDLYAISPHAFEDIEIPVVHITGIAGLNALKRYQTLPSALRVHVTSDPTHEEHLRGRVIARLQDRKELPDEFTLESATEKQAVLIDKKLRQSIASIRDFEAQEAVNYHAVFENNALRSDDLRPFIYPRLSEQHDYDVLATDIARKIKTLFGIYGELNESASGREISPARLHNSYITRCCVELFGRKPTRINRGRRVTDTILYTTVPKYARERGLEAQLMQDLVRSVRIADVEYGSRLGIQDTAHPGRCTIYLHPTQNGPVSVQEIKERRAGFDYFVLRVLGEAIAEKTGTWCKYDVRDGFLHGVSFSLTDRVPAGQTQGMYHELWVGFKP